VRLSARLPVRCFSEQVTLDICGATRSCQCAQIASMPFRNQLSMLKVSDEDL
jgi:hypothetical protein